MLPGDIKHVARFNPFDYLGGGIEFGWLGVLSDIAGVNHEIRLVHPRLNNVDLLDRLLERAGYILVCCFVESDVAVADLHE